MPYACLIAIFQCGLVHALWGVQITECNILTQSIIDVAANIYLPRNMPAIPSPSNHACSWTVPSPVLSTELYANLSQQLAKDSNHCHMHSLTSAYLLSLYIRDQCPTWPIRAVRCHNCIILLHPVVALRCHFVAQWQYYFRFPAISNYYGC